MLCSSSPTQKCGMVCLSNTRTFHTFICIFPSLTPFIHPLFMTLSTLVNASLTQEDNVTMGVSFVLILQQMLRTLQASIYKNKKVGYINACPYLLYLSICLQTLLIHQPHKRFRWYRGLLDPVFSLVRGENLKMKHSCGGVVCLQ